MVLPRVTATQLAVLAIILRKGILSDYQPPRKPGSRCWQKPRIIAEGAARRLVARGLLAIDADGELVLTELGRALARARGLREPAPIVYRVRGHACDRLPLIYEDALQRISADGGVARVRGETARELLEIGFVRRVAEDAMLVADAEPGSRLELTRAGDFARRKLRMPYLGGNERATIVEALAKPPPYRAEALERLRGLVERGIVVLKNNDAYELVAQLTPHGQWLLSLDPA